MNVIQPKGHSLEVEQILLVHSVYDFGRVTGMHTSSMINAGCVLNLSKRWRLDVYGQLHAWPL
jgi:hypothetical protein